jgi:hypothetical protein
MGSNLRSGPLKVAPRLRGSRRVVATQMTHDADGQRVKKVYALSLAQQSARPTARCTRSARTGRNTRRHVNLFGNGQLVVFGDGSR